MRLVWAPDAWLDYVDWQRADPSISRKINELLKDCIRTPFNGIGKPEPLKGALQGWWSRRISGEHRLVYRVGGTRDAQAIEIAQCRLHY